MNNFIYDIPTKVFFGKGQIRHLPQQIAEVGKRVLLVYGGGSIKRSGLYEEIVSLLKQNQIDWQELPGVQANPKIDSVREGIALMRQHQLDCVVAVGGGSTLDCAKAICAGVDYDGDPWELVMDPSRVKTCRPLITVLTMAATGSEMDNIAVISNPQTRDKKGFSSYGMFPRCSILDPVYTFSVPASQTAAGTADIMSHVMESYFDQVHGAAVQDGFSEAMLKTCIHYAPIALRKPDDYEARANLMWTASMAINGLNSLGKNRAWSCHPMEHVLSAYYDITHGVGLAILTPRWMKQVLCEETVDQLARFAWNVWDVDPAMEKQAAAEEGIRRLYQFFLELGIPMTLPEVGIDETLLEEMAAKAAQSDYTRAFYPLSGKDILAIFQACMKSMI